ncbi:hypothetical protein MAR_008981 [Mya arenaria]|uniref:SCP domain-containing protein n=1 Tax=Mya arenaria TaxID=6604 RepID=A0ABY7E0Q9_MYAAR|nr:hypothetical protein MAR_008981 [Mya arenaria]
MISASTTMVGCAVSDCHGYYLYMCLYAPILKPADINTPYNESNRTCGDCPANCNRTANLCNSANMYSSGDELLPWEKGLPNCTSTTSAGITMTFQSTTTRTNPSQSPPPAGTTDFLNNSACGVMQNSALSMVFLALVFALT